MLKYPSTRTGTCLAAIMAVLSLVACNKPNPVEDDEPAIVSIVPNKAKGGDNVTIFGRNLLKYPSFEVSINEKVADVKNATNDSIEVVVPDKAGSGAVVLSMNNMKYNGPEFTYEWAATVSTIAGSGVANNNDGVGTNAGFNCPWGIAVDKTGDLYIADSYNRLIRKIALHSNMVSSIIIPSLVQGANFFSPYNIALDTSSGSAYVTDFNAHLMKISADGDMSVIFSDNMPLAGIGVGHDSRLYVTNNTTGEVLSIDTTGQNRQVYATGLITPRNIAFDKDYTMFVAGLGIYKFDNTGNYTQLVNPQDLFHGWEIAVDAHGDFYEADHFNNVIRKIEKNGTITVIAGNGNAADVDGTALDASFDGPMGIAIDKEGNLYVTTYNFTTGTGNKVRKISFN